MDAKVIVDALNNPSFTNTVISPLIDDCRQLVSQMPHARIKHVFLKANMCANRLDRLGCSLMMPKKESPVSHMVLTFSKQYLRNTKREDLTESIGVVPVKYPSKVKLELLTTLECQNLGELCLP